MFVCSTLQRTHSTEQFKCCQQLIIGTIVEVRFTFHLQHSRLEFCVFLLQLHVGLLRHSLLLCAKFLQSSKFGAQHSFPCIVTAVANLLCFFRLLRRRRFETFAPDFLSTC